MSKPILPREKMEFEKVAVDEWLPGKIVEIGERVNPNKKVKDKKTGEYVVKSVDEVRFVFEFDDYQHRKYSRWMTRSINKESNLFGKYLKKLCPGLEPETGIDIDKLVGVKVRVMWENNEYNGEVYQNVAQIRPVDSIEPEDIALEKDENEELESADGPLPF